jgi:hypothetical protein
MLSYRRDCEVLYLNEQVTSTSFDRQIQYVGNRYVKIW